MITSSWWAPNKSHPIAASIVCYHCSLYYIIVLIKYFLYIIFIFTLGYFKKNRRLIVQNPTFSDLLIGHRKYETKWPTLYFYIHDLHHKSNFLFLLFPVHFETENNQSVSIFCLMLQLLLLEWLQLLTMHCKLYASDANGLLKEPSTHQTLQHYNC